METGHSNIKQLLQLKQEGSRAKKNRSLATQTPTQSHWLKPHQVCHQSNKAFKGQEKILSCKRRIRQIYVAPIRTRDTIPTLRHPNFEKLDSMTHWGTCLKKYLCIEHAIIQITSEEMSRSAGETMGDNFIVEREISRITRQGPEVSLEGQGLQLTSIQHFEHL